MSNDKQSSIDWLLKELTEIGVLNIKSCHWSDEVDIKKALEQAKAMHKQEIINATIYGDRFEGCYGLDSDQYYEKTFGGNNEQ